MTETTSRITVSSLSTLMKMATKMQIKEARHNPKTLTKGIPRQEVEYILIDGDVTYFSKATFRFQSEMMFEMPNKRIVGKNGDMGAHRPSVTCTPEASSETGMFINQMNAILFAGMEAAISKFEEAITDFYTFIPTLVKVNLNSAMSANMYIINVVTKTGNIISFEELISKCTDVKSKTIITSYISSGRIDQKETFDKKGKVWVFTKFVYKVPNEGTVIYQSYSLELPSRAQQIAAGINVPDFRKKDVTPTADQLDPTKWGISIRNMESKQDEFDKPVLVSTGNWLRDPVCLVSCKQGLRVTFVGLADIEFDIITSTPGYNCMKINYIGIAKKLPIASKYGKERPDFAEGIDLTPVEEVMMPSPKKTQPKNRDNDNDDSFTAVDEVREYY